MHRRRVFSRCCRYCRVPRQFAHFTSFYIILHSVGFFHVFSVIVLSLVCRVPWCGSVGFLPVPRAEVQNRSVRFAVSVQFGLDFRDCSHSAWTSDPIDCTSILSIPEHFRTSRVAWRQFDKVRYIYVFIYVYLCIFMYMFLCLAETCHPAHTARLANCIWAFARLMFIDRPLCDAVAQISINKMESFASQSLSILINEDT